MNWKLHRRSIPFIDVPKINIYVGIFVGLCYSFSFYFLLYFCREICRFFSITSSYDVWVLSKAENWFYNLFFAYISFIIGQSVCFTFWFNKPRELFSKLNYRKKTIVNDQRILNWFFLSWFSKLAFTFFIIFGILFQGGFYAFQFFPDYWFVFILIIIILFLQTWLTLRIHYMKNSLKWMLYSFGIVSLLAFGLSSINLVDYHKINNIYQQKSYYYKYNFRFPESEYYEKLEKKSLVEDLYFVESHQQDTFPLIVIDEKVVPLSKLHNKIQVWQSYRDELERWHLTCRLSIHKDIEIKHVNRLKKELSKAGIRKIAYSVIPANHEFEERYYNNNYIYLTSIPKWENERPLIVEHYKKLLKKSFAIDINQISYNKHIINDSIVDKKDLNDKIRELIMYNPDYVFRLNINDSMTFSDYLHVSSSLTKEILELRKKYAIGHYSIDYDYLDVEKKRIIDRRYPLKIFEVTSDLKVD